MRRYRLLLCCVTLVIMGCATELVPLQDADVVPSERVYAPAFTQQAEGKTLVWLRRDSGGFTARGCKIAAYINNDKIAEFKSSEKLAIYLTQGDSI